MITVPVATSSGVRPSAALSTRSRSRLASKSGTVSGASNGRPSWTSTPGSRNGRATPATTPWKTPGAVVGATTPSDATRTRMPSKRSRPSTTLPAGVSAAVMVTGAGSGRPVFTRTTRPASSSVSVGAFTSSQFTSSVTCPSTHTSLPGMASSGAGSEPVETKRPSEVDASPSPTGICRKNPLSQGSESRAVTTPPTATTESAHGDRRGVALHLGDGVRRHARRRRLRLQRRRGREEQAQGQTSDQRARARRCHS